jgi:hypothetical protein
MSKMTQEAAEAALPREKPYKVWDGEGLFLRVRPSGTKVWHLRWESGGRERLKVLGRFPSISVEGARQLAAELRPPMRQKIAVENDIRTALGNVPQTDEERFEAIMAAVPERGKYIYFRLVTQARSRSASATLRKFDCQLCRPPISIRCSCVPRWRAVRSAKV